MPRAFLIKKKRAAAAQQAAVSDSDHPAQQEGGRTDENIVEEKTNEGSEAECSSEEDRPPSHSPDARESPSEDRHLMSSPESQHQHQQHPTDLSMRTAASPRQQSPQRHSSPVPPQRHHSPFVTSFSRHSAFRHRSPFTDQDHPVIVSHCQDALLRESSPVSRLSVEASRPTSSPKMTSVYPFQQRSSVQGLPARQLFDSPRQDQQSLYRPQSPEREQYSPYGDRHKGLIHIGHLERDSSAHTESILRKPSPGAGRYDDLIRPNEDSTAYQQSSPRRVESTLFRPMSPHRDEPRAITSHRDSPSQHRHSSPQGLPPVSRSNKRPSDFSTAFLLSQPSDNKRARSPISNHSPGSDHSPAEITQAFLPYGHRNISPVSPVAEEKHSAQEKKSDHEKIPTIPLPTKYSPPCLSVSSWLETHTSLPLPKSGHMTQIGKTSGSLSPEVDRPHVGLRHDDGFSAFRRNSGREEKAENVYSEKMSRSASAEITSRDAASPEDRRVLSPESRDANLLASPRSRDRRVPSPPVRAADILTSPKLRDRRLTSSPPRVWAALPPKDRLLTSPEKRFAERLFPHASVVHRQAGRGEPPASLALHNADFRRGTSTSPAHSERTSSGSDSPAHSPDISPTQLPRYPGDLAWGQAASSAPSGSPFLHPGLPPPHIHPLLPVGLRYLPGLPLPKPLPDLALPLGYPSSLPDGLASAFRSTRPPFVHPAAAAYYTSLRSSVPYPFSLSTSGGDEPRKAVREEVQQAGLERLEALKALRKTSFEQVGAFQPAQPSAAAAPVSSVQPGHRGSPVAAAAVLSPRANPVSSAPVLDLATGRPSEVSDLPLGVTVPPGLGLEGRMGVEMVKRAKEHEPVRYQCEACNKSYSTFSGLSKHKQFHCAAQVKKEFSCKYCDKTYVSLGALKMHIRTHTLPCKCSVCGKAFSRPWLLQGHVRTHTGEKPFSCPHCQRAFADRSNLRAHLQTHSDVKKYSCRACSKTFSRMSLLLKHEDGCCPNMVQ